MAVFSDQAETVSDLRGKKLLLVCGAARSGTTMLDLMLGNSDDAVSTGEVYAVYRPYRIHHRNPECSCGEINCPSWAGLLDVRESSFHSNIFRQRPNINVVVDSSKDLRWVLDSNVWAYQTGLAVENIVIWKNPIELSYSYWRRGEKVDWYRKEFVRYYGRFLELELPFLAVNYRDLVTDSSATLERLCKRIGIECDANRVNFWEKRHHHFFGSAGTRGQVGSDQGQVRYQAEYPQEFLELFAEEEKRIKDDRKFSHIVESLMGHDISQKPVDATTAYLTSRRPAWYFRHKIKALWWKHFPQRSSVVQ
ncbi:MAG: hypothetical protein P8Y12_00700 [Gammaproteobacteria bacterium]|jgi:hypothetical protein